MLVKRIRNRGANIVVEAHGEVLFLPGAELDRWKRRFSARVREAVIAAAPTNKRPRWGHYGLPLKATIKASTATRITRGGGFFYIATGSTAPHAYYVDQGTGIYAGNGPYEAKILPPWHRGSPSLYESTWRPAGIDGKRVRPVLIRGQRGQHFMDEGLKRAMQSMRLRSYQLPDEGVAGLRGAAATMPTGLLNFFGNTENTPAFRASLAEWRAWRDAAWRGEAGPWGSEGVLRRRHAKMVEKAAKPKRRKVHNGLNASADAALQKELSKPKVRKPVKPKPDPTNKPDHKVTRAEAAHLKRMSALRAEERTLIAAIQAQYPGARILDMRHGSVNGQPYWFFSISRRGVTTNHKNKSAIA